MTRLLMHLPYMKKHVCVDGVDNKVIKGVAA
jgi:hypothetical protein